MRIYFLSNRPCALKVNGVFLGFTDGVERFLELSPKDSPFCEFIPLDGNFLPVVFLLNEKIAASPPTGVRVYLLENGLAIYADKFACADGALRVIEQKNLSFGSLTLFTQGLPQILIEREQASQVIPLNERFFESKIYEFPTAIIVAGKNAVCAIDGEGTPFFTGETAFWNYDGYADELRLTAPLNDLCARTAEEVWSCNPPLLKSRVLSARKALPENFILSVFLQDVLLNAEAEELLSEELRPALADLKAFLGEYKGVTVTPHSPFAAGVVCPKGERVYEVKYFSAEVENGKICNIKKDG